MSNILIVEDDEKLAKILKIQLEHEGLHVENSYTGLDAIERIENHEKFDLILVLKTQ